MVNFQSPPGYLNIYELLDKIAKDKFQKEIDIDNLIIEDKNKPGLIASNYSTEYLLLDHYDLEELEVALQKNHYPVFITFPIIKLGIYETGSHKIVNKNGRYNKKYINADLLLKDIDTFKTMHSVLYLLSGEKLKAYVMHHYTYHKVPKEFWHNDKDWYRLLADGSLYGNFPPIENREISSVVYFKKEEVNKFLSSDPADKQEKDNSNTFTESNFKLRAASRILFTLLSNPDSVQPLTKTKEYTSLSQFILKEKKSSIIDEIERLAESHNIKVIENVQKELTWLNDAQQEELNQTAISREDVKAIATLVRNLHQQKGNRNHKVLRKIPKFSK